MAENINIQVLGMKELDAKLKKFGKSLDKYMQAGMQQAGKEIIQTEGLQKYPPSTGANEPPTPYYIRGRGTQYKYGNNYKSERYGSQYHVDKVPYGARVYNRTSYAQWLAGENQSKVMANIGWRKLLDVAKEKIDRTKEIVSSWISKAQKDAKL